MESLQELESIINNVSGRISTKCIHTTTTVLSNFSTANFKFFFFHRQSSSFQSRNENFYYLNFEKQNSRPQISIF